MILDLYHAGETVTIEYLEENVDLTNATCEIRLEQYRGPLLPKNDLHIHNGLITKEEKRAYHRTNDLKQGFYRYWFEVEVEGSVAIVEGNFYIA